MTFDVACGGAVYLDLTFVGLDRVPRPGEEHWAEDLLFSPGGMANTAIGLARLGLSVAVVSPIGEDLAGRYLRQALEAEGIACAGPRAERSAVTAVLPMHGDRALASFAPPDADHSEALKRTDARSVVVLLDQLGCAPTDRPVYAVTGHAQVHAARLGTPTPIGQAHALLANTSEAVALTGAATAHDAARELGRQVHTAVVTMGAGGAVAVHDGVLCEAPAPVVNVRDATGAGDLFAAGYIWAELGGQPLAERLRLATLYASLSLRSITAFAGAPTLAELRAAAKAPSESYSR